jgi:uncharacterized membrane protein YphA (DoxX/SURF4 family)
MIKNMYEKFPWCNTDSGLLVLRIGVGAIFIMTGWMKFSDLDATVKFFGSLGFSAFWAYLVTATELLSGITVLLGIGVYTRVAAKLLAIVMIVATWTIVHQDPTMAIGPVSLFFSTSALALSGPGKYSIMRE